MATRRQRGIVVLHPKRYRDCTVLGEHVRGGDVVVLELLGMPDDEMHRLVDFASGLIFGLKGTIDRVTPYVLVLCPPGVTAIDDVEHLTGSFFNQF